MFSHSFIKLILAALVANKEPRFYYVCLINSDILNILKRSLDREI